jgi:hypothetical protein
MPSTIKFRRDTADNWTSVDPVLAEGELGYETDTGLAKIGDGTSNWSSLNHISNWGSGGGGGGGFTQEQIEDFVGAMLSGNTETLITVTYQDSDSTIDFVVDNDLSNYDNANSGFITGYTVTQGDVTTHQAALSITESQISDFGAYLTSISSGDVTTALGYTPQNAATAFDGAYSSLTGTPTIPTNNNQLTNGAGYITGYTVTEGDVTAHQAALSITESQISDLGSYQPLDSVLANTTASFTTAQETKLSGIETGATADQTGSEIVSSIDTELGGSGWQSSGGGSGDVTGPASSTDNAVPRFDGTGGKTLQASSFLVDDSGYAQIGATPTFAQTRAFKIYDNGVNGAARMSMIGTSTNSLPPSIEFVLDGNTSRRALVRMEPVDTSNIGIRFYTTNAGTVTNTMDLLPDGELQIDGDLTVGGTVDGRDVAADGTKLDGIESNATADQTGAEMVSAIDSELGSTDWQSGGGGGSVEAVTYVNTAYTPTIGASAAIDGTFKLPLNTTAVGGVTSSSVSASSAGTLTLQAGTYLISSNLSQSNNGSARSNVSTRFGIAGSAEGPISSCGYTRRTGGHDEASSHLTPYLVHVSSGTKTVELWIGNLSAINAGTVTVAAGQSNITVVKIA